jgi:hypothetical protein
MPPDPWPRSLDPAEHEGLRVSAALAARDAAGAVEPAVASLDRVRAGRVRRLVGRAAHAVALRHAFTSAEFNDLLTPWAAATGDPATGRGASGVPPDPTVCRSR